MKSTTKIEKRPRDFGVRNITKKTFSRYRSSQREANMSFEMGTTVPQSGENTLPPMTGAPGLLLPALAGFLPHGGGSQSISLLLCGFDS